MKKLILHIGSHKTGSTSIQNSLNNNDSLLNDNGYSYFNIDLAEVRFLLRPILGLNSIETV